MFKFILCTVKIIKKDFITNIFIRNLVDEVQSYFADNTLTILLFYLYQINKKTKLRFYYVLYNIYSAKLELKMSSKISFSAPQRFLEGDNEAAL